MRRELPSIGRGTAAHVAPHEQQEPAESPVRRVSSDPSRRAVEGREATELAATGRVAGAASQPVPRLAFLGVGWIGRHRMEAIVNSGQAEVVGVGDPAPEMLAAAAGLAPEAELVRSLDDLLALEPDGVVIATPSALHAKQSITALESGAAVFCQKPLGRTAREAQAVVNAARDADRFLAVDLSYRFTDAARRIHELVAGGELGDLFAADLVFHNAYGPDKPWFHDPALSGGGCVMDLGVHLVDLALWMFGFPRVRRADAQLYAHGRPLRPGAGRVEDFASVQLLLETGAVVRLTCSWNLHAGCDAVICASFFGENGGAALRNVDGSFYDFIAERFRGTSRSSLAVPPDAWGGRAAVEWANRLANGQRYDSSADQLVEVAAVLDTIYGR